MTNAAPARVFGLIPAAGRSRRMGEPKQLLAWGKSTILETVIAAVIRGGVDELVVVVNPQVADALGLRTQLRHLTVILDDPDAEMLASIIAGVETLRTMCVAADTDAFLVCPGDLPHMSPTVVGKCCAAYRANPGRIVVAVAGGRPGHPIVVPFARRALLPALRGEGLKGILNQHADAAVTVSVEDETSQCDIDTPEDYRAPDS